MSPFAAVDLFATGEPRDDETFRAGGDIRQRTAEMMAEMMGNALAEANAKLKGARAEADLWRETGAELTHALNVTTNERDALRAELAALRAEMRRLGGAS